MLKLTEKQQADLLTALGIQAEQGTYALQGDEWRTLEPKGLVTSRPDGRSKLYSLTPKGIALAKRLRAKTATDFADPRGKPARTGSASDFVLRTRLDDEERADFEAFIGAEGGNMSEWVREGLYRVGALKRRKVREAS